MQYFTSLNLTLQNQKMEKSFNGLLLDDIVKEEHEVFVVDMPKDSKRK